MSHNILDNPVEKLKNIVIQTINKYNLINKNDKIVIGVSGGPDSMCLLHVLNTLKEKMQFQIYVVHVNHMIREEAEEETQYVAKYCESIGVECFIKHVNVIEEAEQQKVGTEEAGRNARYSFFEEVAQKVGANKIATAHNSNDNAETVLMNIIRGTGTSGLKGIEPIRDEKFIRPIINCERQDIENYCNENGLNPRIDMSNFETIYTRNKIRNLLIPELKETYNPNIIEAINKLSDVASQENEFIQNYAEKIMKTNIIISHNNNEMILDLKKFNEQEIVIKNRIVLIAIRDVIGSTQGIEKIHIDDIVKMCEKNIGNKFLTPNKNIKVSVEKGRLIFSKT